jgi:hypothetical protein
MVLWFSARAGGAWIAIEDPSPIAAINPWHRLREGQNAESGQAWNRGVETVARLR